MRQLKREYQEIADEFEEVYGDVQACSCHINPPCGKCGGSKFEVSPYLINYINYKDGRKKWKCFKVNKEIFDKVTIIENSGFMLSTETLTTGEVALYIDNDSDIHEYDVIEICKKNEYKTIMCNIIKNFSCPSKFLKKVK